MRDVPIHYLRPNHAEWTPASVIFADTETRVMPGTDPEILALDLWAATFTDRRKPRNGAARQLSGHGRDAASFAAWVDATCTGRGTVWLFCHNLAFDLTTTRLPVHLVRLGWELTDAAVGGKAPWLRLRKGSHRLCVTDSWGWLPYPLEQLAEAVNMRKPPLPSARADRGALLARCQADVAILAAAMGQLMAWWDAGRLGNWTLTGSACGWNAMRHRKAPQKFTIDPDPDGVAHDRLAIYGGRRGAFTVGEHRAGPFLELDFRAAYPTIAAHLPVPIKRCQSFESWPVDDWRIDAPDYGIIAEVEIETDVPRWPVRIDGAVFYPVGRFRTVLASPEIIEARRLGCLRSIGAGYVHKLGTALMPWARWCLEQQFNDDGDTPPVASLACKAWGRSVIGKFAAHAFRKIELGPSPVAGWGYEPGWDNEHDCRGGVVDIAGRRWWVSAAGEGENTYPAVLAWVESAVRVRLSRVVEAVGAHAAVQCDTDGLIVAGRTLGTAAARGHLRAPAGLPGPARAAWVLDCLDPVAAPLLLRIKRSTPHVHVLGPQHLATAQQRRLSGIRGTSRCLECEALALTRGEHGETVHCTHIGEGMTLTGKQWPGLHWQMSNGSPAGYVRPTVTATLHGPYVTGWVTADGTVLPAQLTINGHGRNRLLSFRESDMTPVGATLRTGQHPALEAVI